MPEYKVNIACGDSFVPEWRNFDYATSSSQVIKADLLKKLPIPDETADVVYSSHFIEHIPKAHIRPFLAECHRVMRPGSIIRLVLPDFEELCSSYVTYRHNNENEKADFLMLEIIDQCVRQNSGGELGAYYQALARQPENKTMADFVRMRTGHIITHEKKTEISLIKKVINNPRLILSRFERIYTTFIIALLPAAFRRHNVSITPVGERHAWLYDYHTLEKLLVTAGFVNIKRMTSTTSDIKDFPFYPLDINEVGQPRKGAESLYIEAQRK